MKIMKNYLRLVVNKYKIIKIIIYSVICQELYK